MGDSGDVRMKPLTEAEPERRSEIWFGFSTPRSAAVYRKISVEVLGAVFAEALLFFRLHSSTPS